MKRGLFFFVTIAVLITGCTFPQYIWPQKDISSQEINQSNLEKKVLIASRQSEFKTAIIQRIKDSYKEQSVYIKIIGIEDLLNENPNNYSATVIINTAMGWKIDRKVEPFLVKYGKLNSIIVLTTSNGGDIKPSLEGRNIDAISTASIKDKAIPVADKIISTVNELL
jgi:hypothetical protein